MQARHATPTAQFLGQHLPRNATLQDKDDTRQGGAIRDDPRWSVDVHPWACAAQGVRAG
jgi:hypothetical protein